MWHQKYKAQKKKTDKLDFTKIKNFCAAKKKQIIKNKNDPQFLGALRNYAHARGHSFSFTGQFSLYGGPLNNLGLDCAQIFFSSIYTAVLHNWRLVEPVNIEEPHTQKIY